jgi:O-Antigen ligase
VEIRPRGCVVFDHANGDGLGRSRALLTAGATVTTLPSWEMYRVSPAPSAGYRRDRGRRRSAAVLVQGCLLLTSLAVGRAVVETQTIDTSTSEIALAAVGIAAGLAVMLSGPVACLAAIAALTVLRPVPEVSVGGGVDLFAADAFYGALVCWWIIWAARGHGGKSADAGAGGQVRGWPVLLFLGYVGLTLLYVGAVDPGRLSVSFVSWLRLLETASLGWLAVAFLRTRRDATVVLAGGVAEPDAGPLGTRGGGIVNPNALGLTSGLLVLMGAFGALGPWLVYRVPLALWGAVGLVQSQSVASLVATSIALMLGLAFTVAPSRRIVTAPALRVAVALGVGVVLAYGLAAVIRPENLPTSDRFRDSSAGQRTVLAAAGLEVAERNPVIGVGWRRSEQPDVIGDAGLNADLRARFPTTKNDYFPDVSPASVHNTYIQVAADLGLIGLGLFLFMIVSLGRGINRVLKGVSRAAPEHAVLWFMAWGLILVLIWKNDNPLYGGQSETVIPALFVGAIAGLGRVLALKHSGSERSRFMPGERS